MLSKDTLRIGGKSDVLVIAHGKSFEIKADILQPEDIETLYAALVKHRRDGTFATREESNLLDVAQYVQANGGLPNNYGDYVGYIPSLDDVKQLNTVTNLLTERGISWDLQHKGDGVYRITLHQTFAGGEYVFTFEKMWSVLYGCGKHGGNAIYSLDQVIGLIKSLRVDH